MELIKEVRAREILDSRGNPTVEVDISTKNFFARAAVPSGASTGIHEAVELRDNNKRYLGKGVQKAVKNANFIGKKIKGLDPLKQKEIDKYMIELDGTENKSKLGANAILGVSLANARLAANIKNIPLHKHISKLAKTKKKIPTPYMNIINGGKHAGGKLAIQEFMIVPKARKFKESLRMGSETYHILKKIIKKKYGKTATNIGDEGGFAPNIDTTRKALDLLIKAIKKAGYEDKIKIAMDAAASEFYRGEKYYIDGKVMTENKLEKHYLNLIKSYPIISLEDPFNEEDFESFASLTKNSKIQIVGDDLLVTNVNRIKTALKYKACNALLLKVNQIGTLTESINASKLATKNKWNVMVSHRSGETNDSFIADLVVGLGTGQIKSGAPCRSERLAKYNQIMRIE